MANEAAINQFKAAGTLCSTCGKLSKGFRSRIEAITGSVCDADPDGYCSCGSAPRMASRKKVSSKKNS